VVRVKEVVGGGKGVNQREDRSKQSMPLPPGTSERLAGSPMRGLGKEREGRGVREHQRAVRVAVVIPVCDGPPNAPLSCHRRHLGARFCRPTLLAGFTASDSSSHSTVKKGYIVDIRLHFCAEPHCAITATTSIGYATSTMASVGQRSTQHVNLPFHHCLVRSADGAARLYTVLEVKYRLHILVELVAERLEVLQRKI